VNEIEMLIARGIEAAGGCGLAQNQKSSLVRAIAAELRANADTVRVDMEHVVWGMVR